MGRPLSMDAKRVITAVSAEPKTMAQLQTLLGLSLNNLNVMLIRLRCANQIHIIDRIKTDRCKKPLAVYAAVREAA